MAKNKRLANRHTPFRIEVNGRLYGCCAHLAIAIRIGNAIGGYYVVRDSNDRIVMEA